MSLQFDIRQSRVIPFIAMSILMTKMTFSFFSMEMFFAMYASQAGMMLTFFGGVMLIIRNKTLHIYDFLVFTFVLVVEGISLMNGTAWVSWFSITMTIAAYLFLFNYYRDKYHILLLGILIVLSFAIYCQLFQCILHPEKWMISDQKELDGYLLGGNYNQIGFRLIIGLAVSILSLQYGKWFKVNFVLLVISSLAILFMIQSMTSISCILLFLLFCLIKNKKMLSIGIAGIFIGVILFEFLVCFSGTGLHNNELASWLIKDVLGKDMTFTGRTYMWEAALRVIEGSPILGYGYVDKEWLLSNMSTLAIGAHNLILSTIIYGGIILLALYLILVLKSIWHLININDINSKRLISAFAISSIMMLFEVYEMSLIILLLTIMYYYPGMAQPKIAESN